MSNLLSGLANPATRPVRRVIPHLVGLSCDRQCSRCNSAASDLDDEFFQVTIVKKESLLNDSKSGSLNHHQQLGASDPPCSRIHQGYRPDVQNRNIS